jgi:nitroreductase/dihydropteridine reductase
MSFLEKMKSRYTVKKYNPQGTISEEQIQQLKEILAFKSIFHQQPAMEFCFCIGSETKHSLPKPLILTRKKFWTAVTLSFFRSLKT